MKCRRSGSQTAHLKSTEIEARIGEALCDTYGWEFQLKDPDLEVVLFVSDKRWVVGIPVLCQVTRLELVI